MSTSVRRLMPFMILGASMLGVVGSGLNRPVSAKTLVTCGPNGAAYIVEIVPAGCRVLAANSPPKQAGNEVTESRLGFTFNASTSPETRPRATTQPTRREANLRIGRKSR